MQTTLELVAKDYKTALVKKGSTLQPQPMANFSLDPEYESLVRKDVVSQAVQAVRNRIDRYGLSEPTVQQQGDTRLIVELPGVKDPERAIKVIQQAGKLEFKLVSGKLESKTLGDLIGNARKENNLPIAYSADDVKKLKSAEHPVESQIGNEK